MNARKLKPVLIAGALLMGANLAHAATDKHGATPSQMPSLEEVHVWGGTPDDTTPFKVPSTSISAAEMEAINLSSIEDAVAYQPSLTVRRRYIGDANGSLGIRGSNVFQTARILVYADGLPLHYHLQTRWSGAPRWSLVAPDEVESVEVIYGPFSAAYSGNAMGGVVRIKTRTPTERSLTLHGALFNQHFDRLATEEDYGGMHLSASYGDKLGDLTLSAFYNHLENQGQPMNQYFASPVVPDPNDAPPTAVEGGVRGVDNHGNPVIYYGDSGSEESTTDLFKLKTGYAWGELQLSTTVAFEDRSGDANNANNYLRDGDGDPFWNDSATLDDRAFQVLGTNFGAREQDRQSLLLGLGVSGPLNGDWIFDVNLSHFELLKDREISSGRSPGDPAFDGAGSLREYDDTGWTTVDMTSSTDAFAGRNDMSLSLGIHHDNYRLAINTFDTTNWTQGWGNMTNHSTSGGETETQALFAQYGWQLNPAWDVVLGGRYEQWRAQNGFLNDDRHPDRSTSGFSPKFSLGYAPAHSWQLRYSLARALRFALVEELYQNENRTSGIQQANAQLSPEDGIHHNLMVEKSVAQGFIRLNLFHEKIEDTIFNQLGIINGVELSTFLAMDEVTTQGAELIINQPEIWQSRLDLRFNLSYLDATITENSVNPAIEGNRFPRLPEWQSNLLLTYTFKSAMNLSSGLRYASDSFGELENTDDASRTFGAIDSYLFLNLKAGWRLNQHCDLALGVDNVTDEVAYVHHPWPSRTLYLEANYAF